MIEGYKALHRSDNGELTSIIADGESQVIYKEGTKSIAPKWLAEKGYYLLIFDTLCNAKEFRVICNRNKLEIWKVEGFDQVPIPLMLIRPPRDEELFRDLWSRLSESNSSYWPAGTIMVKEVLLINKCEIS